MQEADRKIPKNIEKYARHIGKPMIYYIHKEVSNR